MSKKKVNLFDREYYVTLIYINQLYPKCLEGISYL